MNRLANIKTISSELAHVLNLRPNVVSFSLTNYNSNFESVVSIFSLVEVK